MQEIKVTIDLNFRFKNQRGQYLTDQNGEPLPQANEIVSNFLFNGFSPDKSDKARNRAWSTMLYQDGILEIDKRGIDAILDSCVRAGMTDGIYMELEDYLLSKKEEWDKLKDQQKEDGKAVKMRKR